MVEYNLETYVRNDGSEPFNEWLSSIKDKTVQRKIFARLRRISFGNFGDAKSLKGLAGLCELREHQSPGFRIYYSLVEDKVVLLLAGSTKKDQIKMVAKAAEYLADYKARIDHV